MLEVINNTAQFLKDKLGSDAKIAIVLGSGLNGLSSDIDILQSISRCMSAIASKEHKDAAGKLRNLLSLYNSNIDLISIGAYKMGTNPKLDEAISKIDKINAFLCQGTHESFSLEETIQLLKEAVS